eukprot:gene44258-59039_t
MAAEVRSDSAGTPGRSAGLLLARRGDAVFGRRGLCGDLGLLDALADKAAPLAVMRLVDDTGSLFRQPPVEFRASEVGLPAFGWNVENAELVAALAARLATTAGVRHEPGLVSGITPDEDGVVLSGEGFSLRARLVIGADGRRSRVREAAGIVARDWDYPQSALTAIFAHARDHRDVSTEFHTRKGPFTLVPLPGRRSSLVWLLDPAEADDVAALDEFREDFAEGLDDRGDELLDEVLPALVERRATVRRGSRGAEERLGRTRDGRRQGADRRRHPGLLPARAHLPHR